MKILITGNLGYVGSVLPTILKKKVKSIVGYDIGYFKDCLVEEFTDFVDEQILGDIRFFDEQILKNIDCVVHLAALSNDPLGEFDPKITQEINHLASVNLAKLSKKNNVKKFIFISTQSIYGISRANEDLDEYTSQKNPVTEYAKTKFEAEKEIMKMNDKNFNVVSLRPATVFGYSPRFRSDIVYNNLLCSAYTESEIIIKSDGTPIRPVLHINDLCDVIIKSIFTKNNNIYGNCFNVGYPGGNFTVNQIAQYAANVVGNCEIIYSKNPSADERTYSISFKRLKKEFHGINLTPNLEIKGKEIINIFKKINFKEKFVNKELTVRLTKLKKLIELKKIDSNLTIF